MDYGNGIEPIYTSSEIDAIVRQHLPDFAIAKYEGEPKPYGYIWGCYESANDNLLFDNPIAALCGALNRTDEALQRLIKGMATND
jgi:hypothetical protein